MGWLWLILIGLCAFALLWLGGVRHGLALITAAALLVGGAGYAMQNNAALVGTPVRADAERIDVDPGMVAFRAAIQPASREETAMLLTADDQMRRGQTQAAVDSLLAATKRQPDSAALWTGLGSALVMHDHGQMSPATELAFRRAFALAPGRPGPPFFLGMAYVQAGELAAAKQAWLQALALSPRDAPYRVLIAERLVMIDQFLAMQAGAAQLRVK